jgi:hypothetical protein
LRFAAAACVLVAGLLMGAPGAAVSFAKPPSSDSTAQSDGGANASDQQPSTGGEKLKKTSGGTGTKGHRDSGQQSAARTTSQPNAPAGTGATDETTDSGPVAAVPGAVTSGTGATTEQTGVTPFIGSSTSPAGAAAVGAEATTSGTAAPAPPVPVVVAEAPDVQPAMPVTDVVAPVATLVASVSEGIAWAQDTLTLMFGTVVPLTQLQADLYSFLTGIAGTAPVAELWGGFAGDASVTSQWLLMPPLVAIAGVPVAGTAAVIGQREGMIEIDRKSSWPGMAPLAPNDAIPMFFGYVDSELLLPAAQSVLAAGALSGIAGLAILNAAGILPFSLAALAAIALPGAGGLLTLTAAGVRVGYRQAKAGFALRAAGIAGLARPGPLGVVRSGSLIVIRPRAVARRRALTAAHPLQKVA